MMKLIKYSKILQSLKKCEAWFHTGLRCVFFLSLFSAFSLPVQAVPHQEEVRSILENYIEKLGFLFESGAFEEKLNESNILHQNLGLSDFNRLDQTLREEAAKDGWIPALMAGGCAEDLSTFHNIHRELVEIFVTDKYGMNVCQTNLTSDYYQADEKWWSDAYQDGKGRSYYGGIEYDESAFSEVISIYVPIRSKTGSEIIGIAKAVIDILYIKSELT